MKKTRTADQVANLLHRYDTAITVLFLHLSFFLGYSTLFLNNRFNTYAYREFQRAETIFNGVLPLVGPDTQSGWYLPGPLLNLLNAIPVSLGANFFTFNLLYFYFIYVGIFFLAAGLARTTGVSRFTLAILLNSLSLVQNSYIFLNNSTLIFPATAIILYLATRLGFFTERKKTENAWSVLLLILLACLALHFHASMIVVVVFCFLFIFHLPRRAQTYTFLCGLFLFAIITSTFWFLLLLQQYFSVMVGPVFHDVNYDLKFHLTTQLAHNIRTLVEFAFAEIVEKFSSRKFEGLTIFLILLVTHWRIHRSKTLLTKQITRLASIWLLSVGLFLLLLNIKSNSVHYLVAWAVVAIFFLAYLHTNSLVVNFLKIRSLHFSLALLAAFLLQFFVTKVGSFQGNWVSVRDFQAVCDHFNSANINFWQVRLNGFELVDQQSDTPFILGAYCFHNKGKISAAMADSKYHYLFVETKLLQKARLTELLADAADEIRLAFPRERTKQIIATPGITVFAAEKVGTPQLVWPSGLSDPYQIDSGISLNGNLRRWPELHDYFEGIEGVEIFEGQLCPMPMICSVYLLAKQVDGNNRLVLIAKPLAWNKDPPLTFFVKDLTLLSRCGQQQYRTPVGTRVGFDSFNPIRKTVFSPIWIPAVPGCQTGKTEFQLSVSEFKALNAFNPSHIYKENTALEIPLRHVEL